MDDSVTDEEVEALRVIASIVGNDEDRAASTEELARGLYDAREGKGFRMFMLNPPWHGQSAIVRALEDKDLIQVEVGMAQFHARDEPAPTADNVYLTMTDAGRRALADAE